MPTAATKKPHQSKRAGRSGAGKASGASDGAKRATVAPVANGAILGLGDLKPDPKNCRKHNPRNIGSIADSLRTVGAARSIVIDENDVILAGNGLVEAAGEAGITKVRVVEADGETVIAVRRTGLTDKQKAQLAIADNRTAELAEWDTEQLLATLAEYEIDPASVEFSKDDLAKLEAEEMRDREVEEDEAPDASQVEKRCGAGDLWQLGNHRLLCGDSTKAEDVGRLMGGEKASLCFTSPPYGQQRDYTAEGKAKVQDWDALMEGVFANLPMTDDGQVLVNLGLIHREGEWVPYWEGWIEWMRQQGWRRFGWYVWDQGPGLPGDWAGRFAPAHEFLFHFNRTSRKPNKTEECKWAGEANHGSGLRGSDGTVAGYCHAGRPVQDKKIGDSVIRVSRHKARGIEVEHPAVFSVEFAGKMLEAWTFALGLAYDPFLGSGTTLIAAEQLGRRCFGLEISETYCDIIIARWERLTGRSAVKL